MLPNDITKRQTITAYLREAVAAEKQKNLADIKQKDVFNSVKESEEALGYTLAEFKDALAAALKYEKVQEKVDKMTVALETVELLKV